MTDHPDKMNCCKSTRQQNLGIAEAHLFCPACGAHWWRGKLYRRAEWDAFVNGEIVQGRLFDKQL